MFLNPILIKPVNKTATIMTRAWLERGEVWVEDLERKRPSSNFKYLNLNLT